MSRHPAGARTLRDWLYIIGTAVSLLGLLGSTIAWGTNRLSARAEAQQRALQQKLDAKLDVTTYQRDRTADSARAEEIRGIALDVLCSKSVEPNNRRCHR